MPTGTATSLGRYQAPDPPSALMRLHFFDPETTKLTEVDHEPKIAVLDQEDLLTQGIEVNTFIPGAPAGIAALGSCAPNTETEQFSNILTEEDFAEFVAKLGAQDAPTGDSVYTDTVAAERAAIGTYHAVTDQTGQSSTEWPPTDCGSSGPYLYQWALAQGYVENELIAHGGENICSLLQGGAGMWGTPWMQAWFEPDSANFIDGNGKLSTLEAQIKSGVAGGHEISLSAIEKIAFFKTGLVDPANTVLRFRNHWSRSWADQGSAYVHLSTLVALGNSIDVRRFIPKATV